jgi:hypothetical protein
MLALAAFCAHSRRHLIIDLDGRSSLQAARNSLYLNPLSGLYRMISLFALMIRFLFWTVLSLSLSCPLTSYRSALHAINHTITVTD